MFQGPGVQVVALVPVAGPVPPPIIVVTPDISASSTCCGQMKWMCASMAPAVTIWPSPAMTSVPGPMTMSTPGCDVGIAGLADAGDAPVLDADVGLDDAPVVEDQRVVMTRSTQSAAFALALPHAVADDLAAAELDLFAVDRVVALDLDHELGVGEAHAVARRRAVHVGVGAARDRSLMACASAPMTRPQKAVDPRSPA